MSYRDDVMVVPEVVEAGDDLVFTVYASFPETGRAGGGALDRSAETHFTPAEIFDLGWSSESLARRRREAVLGRSGA